MKKHVNIPIFIPHLGCPNQCVFCNQRTISGVSEFEPYKVRKIIDEALLTVDGDTECEIAFFGGSFTGIGNDLVERLLAETASYLESGRISSIRCSTRPDYINPEVLAILSRYGVKNIELGIQSVSDDVLRICKRGHTFEHTEQACRLITEYGFTLGGQMMIGLPGATLEDELRTARFIAGSGAGEARIYPTIVFKGTELCDMLADSSYSPLSLEEAVSRSAAVLDELLSAGVKVLRIGLCDSDNLHSTDSYVAGPNHAAMGELVIGRLYRKRIEEKIKTLSPGGRELTVTVSRGHTSKAIGQNRINKEYFIKEYGLRSFKVEEGEIPPYEIGITIK